jgi:hypothetical protein
MNQPIISKTNLDNILVKMKMNQIPYILLIIILIISIVVIITTDYLNSFKKQNKLSYLEGFDIPDNFNIPNVDDTTKEDTYDKLKDEYDKDKDDYDKDKDDYDKDKDDYDKYKDTYDKYKDTYDKYKDTYDKYKDTYDKNNNINVKKSIDDYSDSIKSQLLSKYNENVKNIKNKFTNVNLTLPTIKDKKVASAVAILIFFVITIILCFRFIPNFKEINVLFNQISNISYIVIYTIVLILLFNITPTEVMNENAFYIVPITIIIAVFLFIFSFQNNYVYNFNMNYERIKLIIMFFCLVTMCITYYSINPGEYFTKNFNTSLILAVFIGIFTFIYLVASLTLPNNTSNEPNNISSFSKYGSILFILFLIIMTIVIVNYPGGFFKNKTKAMVIISIVLFISIIWSILLVINIFSNDNKSGSTIQKDTSYSSYIRKTLLVLFGFTISGLLISYIVYSLQNLTGKKGIISFVLSILLILLISVLLYKIYVTSLPYNNANRSKNGFFELIFNLILYIPCLFSGVFDTIIKTFISEYNSNTIGNLILLILIIGVFLLYVFLPKLYYLINLQGGKQLVENPVTLNNLHTLATYHQLNTNDNFDYEYSISSWIYINSNAPNTNSSYSRYTSLLNYGGKPNILYKADTNTLMITVDQQDLRENSKNNLIEYDDEGNRIIYKNTNFPLQKWNNIIINFNGGTLDIFLNGELVKSSIEVVPYMKFDVLTIGDDQGINGSICNVVYYKKSLSITNIYYIYRNVKDKTTPVINNLNKTIISLK